VSWDPAWERVFSSQEWGRYPPEELIRFVARRFYGAADRGAVKILELGCGPGANLWYLAREGFAAYGLDGSPTAVRKAGERLAAEGLRAELTVGDVTKLTDLYPAASFDGAIDVACLECNRLDAVAAALDAVAAVLRPGGHVFSMAIARGSWGDGLGEPVEPGTFTGIEEGPVAGKGVCHFFSRDEIDDHFGSRFTDLTVDSVTRTLDGGRRSLTHWLIEGAKPT
jgi:SAM-dependent methyltransferase